MHQGLPDRSIPVLLKGSSSEAGFIDDDDHRLWVSHSPEKDVDEVDLLVLLPQTLRPLIAIPRDALVAQVEALLLNLPHCVLSDQQPFELLPHHGSLPSE